MKQYLTIYRTNCLEKLLLYQQSYSLFHEKKQKKRRGASKFIFSMRSRGGFIASHYVIADDDCDRVCLTLQNHSLYM